VSVLSYYLGIIYVTLAVIRALYSVLFFIYFSLSSLFLFYLQTNIAVPMVSAPANTPVVAGSTAALLDGLF